MTRYASRLCGLLALWLWVPFGTISLDKPMSEADQIIAREGGFVNNPFDKGGATKYGITLKTLSWWLGRPATLQELRDMPVSTAQAIYEARYVAGPGFDKLPKGVLQSNLVDFGVMSGPHLAITYLQEILQVTADGVLGPVTLEALS